MTLLLTFNMNHVCLCYFFIDTVTLLIKLNPVAESVCVFSSISPSVNPPQEVDDPDDLKPEDWDNREK